MTTEWYAKIPTQKLTKCPANTDVKKILLFKTEKGKNVVKSTETFIIVQ